MYCSFSRSACVCPSLLDFRRGIDCKQRTSQQYASQCNFFANELFRHKPCWENRHEIQQGYRRHRLVRPSAKVLCGMRRNTLDDPSCDWLQYPVVSGHNYSSFGPVHRFTG